MAASSIGASENTVKNEIAAPRLIARSFHHPTKGGLEQPTYLRQHR
jgi:hypothetical protein